MTRWCALPVLLAIGALVVAGCIQAPPESPQTTIPLPSPSIVEPAPEVKITTGTPSFYETPGDRDLNDTILFLPGGVYHVGDRLLIRQATILSPGNRILIEVTSVTFLPTSKTSDNRFYGVSGIATVEKGAADSMNSWWFLIDTRGFAPDEYQVQIQGMTVKNYRISTSFSLVT